MSRTVTLRLDEKVYRKFRGMADSDNRPLSNFIETAVLRFVEDHECGDEIEMAEIKENVRLNQSIKKGLNDSKAKRGRCV